MKDLGIYYSEELKTIILGFKTPGQYRDYLNGIVIGHSNEEFPLHAFNHGYRYDNWTEGFVYVGHYTNYTTYAGYMSFLKDATVEQIDAYFKCKKVVLERMNMHVVKKSFNGHNYKERKLKR